MSVTVTELSAFERRLTIRFDRLRLERAETRVARRLSRDVHINGFRRGKAPRRLVERVVGKQRILNEAIEDLLGDRLPKALVEAELAPAVTPSVDDAREVDGGFEVDVRVSLWPTLDRPPDYVGRRFEVDAEAYAVNEETIETEIDRNREQFAELETVERPSAEGDYVAIDLHVSQNGRPVEPVSLSDFLYEVGSEGLLAGLDEELAGLSAGDIGGFAGALHFEADGLKAGTPVDVRVLVKEVKERRLPELDDDWVSDFTEFDTVEEFREDITHELEDSRLDLLRREFTDRVMTELVGEMDVDIPQAVIDTEAATGFDRFYRRLEGGGLDFEDFLEVTGQDRESLSVRFREDAERRIRTRLLLDSVASDAGLEVQDTELAEAYEAMAERSDETGPQLAERLAGSVQETALVGDILRSKAAREMIRSAVAEDRHGNVIDLRFDPPEEEDIVEAVIVDAEIERGDQ